MYMYMERETFIIGLTNPVMEAKNLRIYCL